MVISSIGNATPSSPPSASSVAANPTTVSISVMSRSNPTTSCSLTRPSVRAPWDYQTGAPTRRASARVGASGSRGISVAWNAW